MRNFVLSSLILSVLPFAAAAQTIVRDAPSVQPKAMLLDRVLDAAIRNRPPEATRVVPLWSTPDGRIMAAVALAYPSQLPLAPASPQLTNALDWRLIDASALFAGRIDVRLGSQVLANARLTSTPMLLSDSQPVSQFGCSGFGGGASLGWPTCPDQADNIKFGHLYSGDLGAGWSSGPLSMDINLGLAWLDASASGTGLAPIATGALASTSLSANDTLPSLVLPRDDFYRLDSSAALGAHGRWAFRPGQWLDLGANVGRIRLLPDNSGGRTDYSQTAISLGLGTDSISGSITGRVFNPLRSLDTSQQRWAGIDLGFTWHTPWQAELSVGAQNLWTNPPLTGSDADNQARTPYVQYRQDL